MKREIAIREIKKILKNGRSVNQTSVMLKHGPMKYDKGNSFFHNGRNGLCKRCVIADDNYFMHLNALSSVLTGDIDISNVDVLHVLNGAPIVLQYPHHGRITKGKGYCQN